MFSIQNLLHPWICTESYYRVVSFLTNNLSVTVRSGASARPRSSRLEVCDNRAGDDIIINIIIDTDVITYLN